MCVKFNNHTLAMFNINLSILLRPYFLLIVLVVGSAFSQTFDESALWIKPITFEKNLEQDSLQFFLNYHPTITFNKDPVLVFQDKLQQDNTYFFVFKSLEIEPSDSYKPSKVETVFSEFHYNGAIFKISDAYFHSNKHLRLKEGEVKKGLLVSYSGSFEQKLDEKINFTFIQDKKNIALYETIIIPSRLSKEQRDPVLTYLSLKYGVSLEAGVDYRNKEKEILWDFEKNKDYSKRITGLGREDYFELYQKQTKNSTDSIITLGLGSEFLCNSSNKSELENSSYLLYGDNDKALHFSKVEGKPFEKLARTWRFYKTKNFQTDSVYVTFNLSQLSKEWQEEEFYLHVSNSPSDPVNLESLRVLKGVVQDSVLVFNNTELGKTKYLEGYFSLYKRDLFEAEMEYINDCELGNHVNLKIIGGLPPYEVTIKGSATETKTWVKKVSSKETVLRDLPSGEQLSINIKDVVGNTTTIPMSGVSRETIPIFLASSWDLKNEEGVVISPLVSEEVEKNDLQFEWNFRGEVISKEPKVTAKVAGDYSLRVSSKEGCVLLPFEVKTLEETENRPVLIKEKDGIYPNPVESGEEFTVKVNLPNQGDVRIHIYTLKGQFLHSKFFVDTNYVEYQNVLNTPGVYLVIVKTANDTEVLKLVVK